MGIPKFFRYITTKYTDIISDNVSDLDNLFFDLNCMIHPCTHRVIARFPDLVNMYNNTISSHSLNSITAFEAEVYIEIESYLRYLIGFANPQKLIYLAIDGVAPRSKMKQQRLRRYKSVLEKNMRKVIDHKYRKTSITLDTNCITPGTLFMKKLSCFIKRLLTVIKAERGVAIILNDSGIKGEGEHKILQYMKTACREEVNCIYGLDADLIMLALVSNCPRCFLLRESVHFGKVDTEKLLFFDIELFSDKLYKSIETPIMTKHKKLLADTPEYIPLELIKSRTVRDYICLCFFIGNDFLPHLTGIDINNGGVDKLLDIYIENFIVKPYYLVNEDHTLNLIFVKQIINKLYNIEDSILRSYQKKVDRYKPRLKYSNEYELALEKLRFYPKFNNEGVVKFGEIGWRDKYYKYYFNITNHVKNEYMLNNICNNYIVGLQWNCYYYFDTCVSYSWYYKYSAAPTLKDLSHYFIKRVYPAKFIDIEFSPLEQLAIVLPKESKHLWSKAYAEKTESDAELSLHYPKTFKLDLLNKHFLWQCEPLLDDISNESIKNVFAQIELTETEKILNAKTKLYIL